MIKSKEKWDFIESLDKTKFELDYSTRSVPQMAVLYNVNKKWIISALDYYNIKQHSYSEVQKLNSVREQYKNTCLEKYDVINTFNLESARVKATSKEARLKAVKNTKQSNLKKYGVESTNQVTEIKAKQRLANIESWQENHDERLTRTQNTNIKKFGTTSYAKTIEFKNWYRVNSAEFKQKELQSRHENHTTMSKPEDYYYTELCNKYGSENVYRQYKDSRYPFCCDFYIKSEDKFIELNLHWTHGYHPFDANNYDDLKKLDEWKIKAETSSFYKSAIEIWTIKDPEKLKYAQDNNLNYCVYYKYNRYFEKNQNINLS